jgi:hypothetical protein
MNESKFLPTTVLVKYQGEINQSDRGFEFYVWTGSINKVVKKVLLSWL